MTWVIASNVPLVGYALAISDIRVTFGPDGDRQQRDCLQKIHCVGQHLAAGFAGSVQIGFEMIRSLQKGLKLDDPLMAWEPTVIAEEWPITARKIFNKYPASTQSHGCQILLIGAHPTEHVGATTIGKTYVHSFSWPNFEPVQATPYEVLSIGSGSDVVPYRDLLQRYATDHEFRTLLMHGESMPGGTATMFGLNVTNVVRDNPGHGISPHLHLCIVRRGEVQIWPNDHSHKGRWQAFSLGPPTHNPRIDEPADMEKFEMPRVATTYDELLQMLNGDAVLASTAVAHVSDDRQESASVARLPQN